VVKIGRMAGQFAKPRSEGMEERNGVSLPSYRGDNINDEAFTAEARVPDPWRLVQAYNQSASTLNLLRGFSNGGYANLSRTSEWNLGFMANSAEGKNFLELGRRVDEAIQFMQACGLDTDSPLMNSTEFYVNHECLHLDYETALTRLDSTTDKWYDCSAHLVWCGERTRQTDKAHVEFLRGVANPLGVKISDKADPATLIETIDALNPDNVPGRILVIVRMGAEKLREKMPALVKAVQESGHVVTWVCDPMHGNTEKAVTENGTFKTRRYERVRAEVEAFFDVHEQMGSIPGGVHFEMTGKDVTECTGGGSGVSPDDLASRYHTHCDPRLNAEQSLELAFYCAQRLRERRLKKATEAKVNSMLWPEGFHT
jgi:3-deoxy-7-phosphoheptulonate synthase